MKKSRAEEIDSAILHLGDAPRDIQIARIIRRLQGERDELRRIVQQAEPWVMELRAQYDRQSIYTVRKSVDAENMTRWIEWERAAIKGMGKAK